MGEQETVSDLLSRAIRAVREKRREEGQRLLLQVIERDERNEQAWLWLSGVVDDPRDMQVALANALVINPANEQARKGLELLQQRYGDLLPPEAAPASVPAETAAPAGTAAPASAEEEVVSFNCYHCRSEVYEVADFCWNCHAVVHCCENCVYRRETSCREKMGIRGPAAMITVNRCTQWRPR